MRTTHRSQRREWKKRRTIETCFPVAAECSIDRSNRRTSTDVKFTFFIHSIESWTSARYLWLGEMTKCEPIWCDSRYATWCENYFCLNYSLCPLLGSKYWFIFFFSKEIVRLQDTSISIALAMCHLISQTFCILFRVIQFWPCSTFQPSVFGPPKAPIGKSILVDVMLVKWTCVNCIIYIYTYVVRVETQEPSVLCTCTCTRCLAIPCTCTRCLAIRDSAMIWSLQPQCSHFNNSLVLYFLRRHLA